MSTTILPRCSSGAALPCFRCGVCCTVYQVRVGEEEAKRLSATLGIPWDAWLRDYADPRWPGVDSFLLRQENGACVFLERVDERTARCRIHVDRPSSCREWTPGWGRPECREGLVRGWGLSVDSLGRVRGAARHLAEFRAYLESLRACE